MESNGVWMGPGTPVCTDVAVSAGEGVAINEEGVTDAAPRFYALQAFVEGRVGTLIFDQFAMHKLYGYLHNEFGEQ